MQLLLNATYDLQPTLQTPDYLAVSEMISKHVRKRSLVVLLTNLRDEDDSTLQPALHQLRQRHLVMVASLRESCLDKLLSKEVDDFDGAHSVMLLQLTTDKHGRHNSRGCARKASMYWTSSPPQLPVRWSIDTGK